MFTKASLFISALFLIMTLALAGMVMAQQKQIVKENISYKWAFVAKAGEGDAKRAVTILRDTALRSGTEFKLFVNLQKVAYLYVIHKSSTNELGLLFPYSIDGELELEKNYYIPKGRVWYKLDKNVGQEVFYILASTERLTELENAMRKYMTSTPEKRVGEVQSVITVVKDTKKRFRTFETLAERPISIAGNVRGTRSGSVDVDRIDIATLATEISANNFYSKTITIDHK